MSYILERFERWRWIHPLPSNPPRETCLNNEMRVKRKKKRRTTTRSCWLSLQNQRKNKIKNNFSSNSSRLHIIKQKHLQKCLNAKEYFKLHLGRENTKQNLCCCKCLNYIKKTCHENKTFNLSLFLRYKKCNNHEKPSNVTLFENCKKKRKCKKFLNNSCFAWVGDFLRKTGNFFRVIFNSSQTSTFKLYATKKFKSKNFDGEETQSFVDDEEVKLCKENLISNNSKKIVKIKECNNHPLLPSSTEKEPHKSFKGYFFAPQVHEDYEIDMNSFTPLDWNRNAVLEEKYFDPRLYSNRLNEDGEQSCKHERPKLLTFQTHYPQHYKKYQKEKVIDHHKRKHSVTTLTMQQMETIQQSDKNHHTEYLTNGISPHVNMSDVEDEDQNDNLDEMEDDDPGKLLNEWLGELNTLKQGLDSSSKTNSKDSHPSSSDASPLHEGRTIPSTLANETLYTKSTQDSNAKATNGVVKRLKNNDLNTNNTVHRKSLINLEEVASSNQQTDDEWDAILGELSVLETQFNNELNINGKTQQKSNSNDEMTQKEKLASGINRAQNDASIKPSTGNISPNRNGIGTHPTIKASNKRMESPDNDSAFCDNLSVLSSSNSNDAISANGSSNIHSYSKNNRPVNHVTGGMNETKVEVVSPITITTINNAEKTPSSSSGVSSSASPSSTSNPLASVNSCVNETGNKISREEQEARIKAEKIKIAIEKIKEANIKKLFVKVFSSDGSAKSLLVDEKMTVGHVTRILAEKNHVQLDPKWALVELVPELYMERVYEDNENLVENCLMWKVDSKNTLWFIERPEKCDLFLRPEIYLLGSSSSQKGDSMEDHSRQELLEEYFSSSGVGAPEGVEGFIWLKAEGRKSWKKFFFVLRSSGLYYSTSKSQNPKKNGKSSGTKDLVCLATFDVNQVYYGSGWQKKYKAPTNFCFAIKHPKIQAKTPKYIRYLCVESEKELHKWVTAIRVAKNGRNLYTNYRSIVEEIAHADIDILTSKRFSGGVGGETSAQNTSSVPCVKVPVDHHPNSNSRIPQTLQVDGNRKNLDNGIYNNNLSSPARTPSSENKSFDSALSSGIVSDISSTPNPSASSEYSEFSSDMDISANVSVDHRTLETDDATPVNTIQRHPNVDNSLRRSVSRASKSSSPETASTSSGCHSDRGSSSGGSGNQPYIPAGVSQELNKNKLQQNQGNNVGGFDTDYHVGGTIKKRPPTLTSGSSIANPRLPLTNTTWGLVARDSDEDEISSLANSADSISDSSSGRGGNIRIGGGGTLLRCSTALRKNSQNSIHVPSNLIANEPIKSINSIYGKQELPLRSSDKDIYKDNTETMSNYSDQSRTSSNNQSSIVQAQVHNNPNHDNSFNSRQGVDVISEEFENRLSGYSGQPKNYSHEEEDIPLPPPPGPVESAQPISSNHCIPHADDLDDLPPPPPEIYEPINYHTQMKGNVQFNQQPNQASFQQKQNLIRSQLPPTLPPSSLKSPQQSNSPSANGTQSGRKGILSSSNGSGVKRISFDDNVQLIGEPSYPPSGVPMDDQQERYRYRPRQPYICNPRKLFQNGNEASNMQQITSNGATLPPKDFLKDLQRVMTKKWQVAEKCREGSQTNMRTGNSTSAMLTPHQVLGFRDPVDILGSGHNYSRDESVGAWILQTQQYTERQQHRTDKAEPLYAISKKHPQEEQAYAQNHLMNTPSNMQDNPNNYQQLKMEQPYAPNMYPNHPGLQHPNPVISPVVLREPTPDLDAYAPSKYPNTYPNVNTISNHLQNKMPPPPQPTRSPNTQTYDQNGHQQIYETVGNTNMIPNGHFANGEQRQIHSNPSVPQYQAPNYPPHASSIGHITSNSFNVGGCAYTSHKKSMEKPRPPPPKRSETTQLSTK